MILEKEAALSFDDVQLLDGYNTVFSRSEIDLLVEDQRSGQKFNPIICAPMMAVNSLGMARALSSHGMIHCMHRYSSVQERIEFIKGAPELQGLIQSGVAIGLTETKEDIVKLYEAGYRFFNLDVAAANSKNVFEQLKRIKPVIDSLNITLCVGNFADDIFILNLFKYKLLESVSYIKTSIGSGSACSTRIKTGVGKPLLQSIIDASRELNAINGGPKIIADGGIRTSGDMAKAFGAGASACMVGSMFAAHDEGPKGWSKMIDEDGELVTYYLYFGMASETAKKSAGKPVRNIEGAGKYLRSRGSIHPRLDDIKESLQSSLSLQGFRTLEEAIGQGHFVRITSGGTREASLHINEKK